MVFAVVAPFLAIASGILAYTEKWQSVGRQSLIFGVIAGFLVLIAIFIWGFLLAKLQSRAFEWDGTAIVIFFCAGYTLGCLICATWLSIRGYIA
jgi:phosphoglycerol transferase MdoB-like AlkP superfamily enzyme